MKKKFIPLYDPPRLVQGDFRWYVLFYAQGPNGKRARYRPTFNLNRIKDLNMRKRRGKLLVRKVNWWLETGRTPWLFEEMQIPDRISDRLEAKTSHLEETTLIDSIEFVIDLKIQTTRRDSARSYKSIGGLFIEFMKSKKWGSMAIMDVTRQHAAAYMDHCILVRKVGDTTYNNNIRHLRAMFSDLIERGYLDQNPFKEIKYKPKPQKKRRPFNVLEARIVIQEIRKVSPMLFYALLLEYCCFLRPAEIRKLRIGAIDLHLGIVTISQQTGKTKIERHATIPDDFLKYFDPEWFKKFPPHYYLFGANFHPHPSIMCGHSTMYRKHRSFLEKLLKKGLLDNIEGLQWYSWKDTGITDALGEIPLIGVQDQAGHHSPEMTLRYRHKKRVNQHMKGFRNKVI